MKILLIVPTFQYKDQYPVPLSLSDFPTGLAYIAAALKRAGHEVYGLNPNNIVGYADAFSMIKATVTKKIREVQPDLIGTGGLCIDYKFFRDIIGVIREVSPGTPVVLGGQIVTNDAEFIFNDLKPDYAIAGEGEEAICKLANGEPVESIDNIWYWREK